MAQRPWWVIRRAGDKSGEVSGRKGYEVTGSVENARIWPPRAHHFNSVT